MKKAQIDPMMGGGMADPMMGGGMGDPMMGGGMGTMQMADEQPQQAPEPVRKIIYSPLDGVGKILSDVDLKSTLSNEFTDDPKTIAMKIWTMYGGNPDGLTANKTGKRKEAPYSSDMMQQTAAQEDEYNRTRDKRWERLPEGKTIADITNAGDLERVIEGSFNLMTQQFAPKAQTSSSLVKLIKVAENADNSGDYKLSDKIYKLIYVYLS